ncbi:RNA polymerase sigma-70 factor (ECF subfamily) [Microbacterium phyllosphaerae]|uniref:RNA polymerase sigma-70 factor (ECF subfamily) n=1 Tax=Microbacterium phyllosphaerae TaxID=124798 RepID=A0ABS4WL95_9MICO|nr:hypothetical protein [Microbacterium phyllosphaerae]MBP2376978.1 RNA polymerase sigma-70 factor (ECF subfamily) [Microbacterium phyllosphaerae]
MTRRQYPAWLRRKRRGAADRDDMEALAIALAAGDRAGIRAVLHSHAVLIVDSGGLIPRSAVPIGGRVAASAGLAALMTPETSVVTTSINGVPGLVFERGDTVLAAVTAESRSGLLTSVWVVCNPEKLRHWNRGPRL